MARSFSARLGIDISATLVPWAEVADGEYFVIPRALTLEMAGEGLHLNPTIWQREGDDARNLQGAYRSGDLPEEVYPVWFVDSVAALTPGSRKRMLAALRESGED